MERMTSENDLMHWGIKGQKWGVRRFQNPDGTLTDEGIKRYQKKYPYQNPDGSLNEKGKKKFMTAAKEGKLDYKNLSDKDLDMINNRFNKENTYQRNVSDYKKSTFKYKAEQAVLDRIKNGFKGKNGGKKGGGMISDLLATPIKAALKDAFKEEKEGKKGNKDNNDDDREMTDDEWYDSVRRNRAISFQHEYNPSDEQRSVDMIRGRRFLEEGTSGASERSESSESILRNRERARTTSRKEDNARERERERQEREREKEERVRERQRLSAERASNYSRSDSYEYDRMERALERARARQERERERELERDIENSVRGRTGRMIGRGNAAINHSGTIVYRITRKRDSGTYFG